MKIALFDINQEAQEAHSQPRAASINYFLTIVGWLRRVTSITRPPAAINRLFFRSCNFCHLHPSTP
jgi:hypothetical protein